MTILEIIEAPDARLKVKSKPVEAVDDSVRRLLDDMLDSMYEAKGIGLAAIQVGASKRILVIDLAENDEKKPLFVVNPEIISSSDELAVYSEGCLSVPEHYADIERPATVKVRYLDYNGDQQEQTMTGLLATCIQHEIDHLDGILFIDHLSRLKRSMVLKKLEKARKLEAVT